MTEADLDRKKRPLEPVFRVADEHADLDGVLVLSADHLIVFWTMPVAGKREVVGVEVAPKPRGKWSARLASDLTHRWFLPRLKQLNATMPPSVVPVSASTLRGLPLRDVMAFRKETLPSNRFKSFPFSVERADGTGAGITKDEMARSEVLRDAVDYVLAIRDGRSPASVIAERRTISKRTAEGRIARARELGYLTPATGRRSGGSLTDHASDLLDRLGILAEALDQGGPDNG